MKPRLLATLPSPLWVLGTDTNVGKTWMSARIAESWGKDGPVHYRKPFQCGVDSEGDPGSDLSALRGAGAKAEAFASFRAPLSPLAAADLEGLAIDLDAAAAWCLRPADGRVLLEGVGGLMVPLTRDRHFLAWASDLKIPCVLVARGGLGTLNHTLLSCESLMLRGWRIEAVLLNPGVNQSFDAVELNAKILREFLPMNVDVVGAPANSNSEMQRLQTKGS